jgi:DNA invertase Pin-like site-specific DNA recombinase
MKAFAYIRVSGKGQVEGTGLDRQEEAIKAYASAHSIELCGTFADEGVSGTLEIRPALAKLLLSLEENGHGVKTVLIEKVDRLARDLMIQEAIISDLKKKGFQLISVHEGDDLLSNDPTRTMIRQILGAVAQYDKSMTVLKLQIARAKCRQLNGKCEGRKSYTETDPALVERIRELSSTGNNSKAIAAYFNQNGTRTRTGKEFTASAIRQILHRTKVGRNE